MALYNPRTSPNLTALLNSTRLLGIQASARLDTRRQDRKCACCRQTRALEMVCFATDVLAAKTSTSVAVSVCCAVLWVCWPHCRQSRCFPALWHEAKQQTTQPRFSWRYPVACAQTPLFGGFPRALHRAGPMSGGGVAMNDPNTSFGQWFKQVAEREQQASRASGGGNAGAGGGARREGVMNKLMFWRSDTHSTEREDGTDVERGGLLPSFMSPSRGKKPPPKDWCDCGLSAYVRHSPHDIAKVCVV